jgi:hypothetical protein
LLALTTLMIGVVVGGWSVMIASPKAPSIMPSLPTSTTTTVVSSTAAPMSQTDPNLYLVWTSGGLPEGFTDTVSHLAGVEAITEVWSDLVYIIESSTPEGFAIPIEAFAVDPRSFVGLLPPSAQPSLSGLSDGTSLLGSTSARLRQLDQGVELRLGDGTTLPVTGVIDDALVGAAELVVNHETGTELGVVTPRFLLLVHRGARSDLEEAVRSAANVPVRIRAPGETPYLRHGDAVLPQSLIKDQFGEFALRPGSDRQFTIEPAWVNSSIVTDQVPTLGTVRCHRSLMPLLAGAMDELEMNGLANLVNKEGFEGCWNPRLIAVGRGVSRHAWGAAVDINFPDNPTGLNTQQDPRLIEVMIRWGFTWGGNWLVPDPNHFEYVGEPLATLP